MDELRRARATTGAWIDTEFYMGYMQVPDWTLARTLLVVFRLAPHVAGKLIIQAPKRGTRCMTSLNPPIRCSREVWYRGANPTRTLAFEPVLASEDRGGFAPIFSIFSAKAIEYFDELE